MTRAHDEIIDFIAAGTSPGSVVAFRPSEEARLRIADLIDREKSNALSPDEVEELDQCLWLEHLMRLAKARARRHLPGSSDDLT